MKKILISIRPEWVEKILNKEKKVEIRKSQPKCKYPCEVYIYCTKGGEQIEKFFIRANNPSICYSHFNGKIVAKFILNKVFKYNISSDCVSRVNIADKEVTCYGEHTCITWKQLVEYAKDKNIYAWFIEDLEIFDKPKELEELNIKKAPQSWCYIKEK